MIEITINWIDELVNKLNNANVKWALNNAVRKSVFVVQREAQLITPVRTWLLRNSYETSFWDLEWTLNNFREYAPFVDARVRFMGRAADASENQVINIFNEEVDALLRTL